MFKNKILYYHTVKNRLFVHPASQKTSNGSKCDAKKSQSTGAYVRTPTLVYTFPILPQIIRILERENLVLSAYQPGLCRDVLNCQRHYQVVKEEKRAHFGSSIVTLTLNSNGTLIKRLSRSLWITCACITELPRSKRFDINNI